MPFLSGGVATVLASVACAQLPCGWTHIVLTSPNRKPWYQRLPPTKQWKRIALPTAILAIAEQVSLRIPFNFLYRARPSKAKETANLSLGGQFVKLLALFGILMFGMLLTAVLVLPAEIILVRVQASLLPDSEETIVPFDRSFDGKLGPGGNRVLSMLDAWKTFDFNAKKRLVKAYVEKSAIQILLFSLLVACLLAEVFVIVGTDFSTMFPEDKEGLRGNGY
jgi:hypothetical protein